MRCLCCAGTLARQPWLDPCPGFSAERRNQTAPSSYHSQRALQSRPLALHGSRIAPGAACSTACCGEGQQVAAEYLLLCSQVSSACLGTAACFFLQGIGAALQQRASQPAAAAATAEGRVALLTERACLPAWLWSSSSLSSPSHTHKCRLGTASWWHPVPPWCHLISQGQLAPPHQPLPPFLTWTPVGLHPAGVQRRSAAPHRAQDAHTQSSPLPQRRLQRPGRHK